MFNFSNLHEQTMLQVGGGGGGEVGLKLFSFFIVFFQNDANHW